MEDWFNFSFRIINDREHTICLPLGRDTKYISTWLCKQEPTLTILLARKRYYWLTRQNREKRSGIVLVPTKQVSLL